MTTRFPTQPVLLLLLSAAVAATGCRRSEPADAPAPSAEAAQTPAAAAAPADREAARQALKEGRWAEAEPVLLELWRADADAEAPIDGVLVVASRSRRGDLQGALAVLSEAEAQDRSKEAQADLATAVASNLRDPRGAADVLRDDARNLATAPRALMVARVLQRAGRVRESALFWKVAERLDPEEPLYPRELAHVAAQTGDTETLEAALRRHLGLQPADLASRVNLAQLELRTEGPDAAVAATLAPEGVLPEKERHILSGKALLRIHLAPQALAAFDAALAAGGSDSCEALYGQALAGWTVKPGPKPAERLWRLVTEPVAGQPCHAVQAARALLSQTDLEAARAARERLQKLVARKKTADPVQLEALLEMYAEGRVRPARPAAAKSRRSSP